MIAFISWIPVWAWKGIALILLLAGIWTHGYIHGHNGVQRELDTFKAQVAEKGAAQAIAARQQETRDRAIKEKVDADHTIRVASLTADLARLRKRSADGGGLSAPAPSAASPKRTCFDPAKLDAALRTLDLGVLGIVETGSRAVEGLDTARGWAQSPR